MTTSGQERAKASFYRTSGTLHRDDRCYVVRQADTELYSALMKGNYCYVLTARQMGKSSLTVRTAEQLKKQGVGVAVVDLTAIGQNLSAEQWYGGVLAQIGRRLKVLLEDQLLELWDANHRLGPLQRWMGVMRHAVVSHPEGPVVIFIDEVDAVQSLPFSTDEFFAGVRELYNRRSEDSEMQRLTFCLLGVAIPSDLIRDSRTTPFNIGQRIELHDFTSAEAETLAQGLRRSQPEAARLLDRVLHWTGGHPYLTQRLCQAVAEDNAVNGPEAVDSLCAALFFTPGAREQDDNLLFVRERLLRSEVDRVSLLSLYAKVRRGRRVIDDQANPLVTALRLSGIVRGSGELRNRNRIYARVFDLDWVKANMPDAELRRQRRARLQGAMLATAISAVVVVIIAALALVAVRQRDKAVRQEEAYRRLLYTAQINLAQQAYEVNDIPRALELLDTHSPTPGQEDLRRFEWYYLKHYSKRSIELPGHALTVYTAAISRDGRTLATGGMDKTVRLWDLNARSHIRTWNGYGAVRSVAFSPDGRILAAASEERLTLWDVAAGSEIHDFVGRAGGTWSVAWSPDGRLFAVGGNDGTIELWDVKNKQLQNKLQGHSGIVKAIAFSPDSRLVATASYDNTAKVWDVTTAQERGALRGHTDRLCCVVFSPDGKRVATGSADRSARIWDLVTTETLSVIQRRSGAVQSLLYFADGKRLAIGGPDGILTIWDLVTEQEMDSLKGHRTIWGSALSPDGSLIATTGAQGSVRLWLFGREWQERAFVTAQDGWQPLIVSPDARLLVLQSEDRRSLSVRDVVRRQEMGVVEVSAGTAGAAAITRAGNALALCARDGTVRLWDLHTRRPGQPVESGVGSVSSLAFSADGKLLAIGGLDGTGTLWDVAASRIVTQFEARPGPLYSLAFSPDSRMLAGGAAGVIKLWELSSGKEAAAFRGPWSAAWALAFSPDGRTLAAGLNNYSAQSWDVASGRELAAFKAHSAEVLAVTFSPDGSRLATGSSDNTVRLWDVASAQPLLTFRDHGTAPTQVAFSPDGSTLASVSVGRNVRFRHASIN